MFNVSDNYQCKELNGGSSSNLFIILVCDEYHRIISCETTVATPMNFEINSRIANIEIKYKVIKK